MLNDFRKLHTFQNKLIKFKKKKKVYKNVIKVKGKRIKKKCFYY